MSHTSTCALLISALILCTPAHAQQPTQPEPQPTPQESPARPPFDATAPEPTPAHRPHIGLALSGGGARGLAHIGVLKWMEENHIPVDSVAGTSMGGLVGGMYATGMSPAEMENFVEHIDWDDVLLSEPTYDQLSYRRKQDRRSLQVSALLGIKKGLRGPNGLSPGHGVGLLIDKVAFPYSTISSFDDLPTPFRCVATDMLNGGAVVLKDGSLAESLRATMAIPGVFTPVDLNGRLLADGGIVDNIPTDVARTMDADIVIAVDIVGPLSTRDKLQNISGMLDQTISLMSLEHDRRSLREADLVLAPDLGDTSIFDFNLAQKIIRMGYEGAARRAVVLRRFAASDAEWRDFIADRESRKRTPQTTAQALAVTGVPADQQQYLEKRLQKTIAKGVDEKRLDARLTHIVGEGRFDSLGYEGFVQNGVPALRVVAHEKTYGPPFIDFAVNVDGSGTAAFDFSAGARVTFMDVDHHGGEWRNDLLLGSSNLAATEFYQPLGNSHVFVAPFAFASKFARNAFEDTTRVAIFGDERAGGGLDLGYDSGRRSEFRLGYEIFDGKLDPLVGSAGLPVVSGSTGEVRARYVWDGEDSPSVPGKGSRVTVDLSRVLQSPGLLHPIGQLDVQTSTFIPTGPKTSLFYVASGGTTFHGEAGPFQVFALGGPFHLGAYLPQEFIGNHYAYSSLGFRRELYRLPQFVGRKIYWAGWYEAGSAWGGSILPGTISPGTAVTDSGAVVVRGTINLGIIAETFVGPVGLGGSVSPTGQSRLNFSIGRLF